MLGDTVGEDRRRVDHRCDGDERLGRFRLRIALLEERTTMDGESVANVVLVRQDDLPEDRVVQWSRIVEDGRRLADPIVVRLPTLPR